MPLIKVGAAEVEYDQRGAGRPLLLLHSLLTEMTVFDLILSRLTGHITRIKQAHRAIKRILSDTIPAEDIHSRVVLMKVYLSGLIDD